MTSMREQVSIAIAAHHGETDPIGAAIKAVMTPSAEAAQAATRVMDAYQERFTATPAYALNVAERVEYCALCPTTMQIGETYWTCVCSISIYCAACWQEHIRLHARSNANWHRAQMHQALDTWIDILATALAAPGADETSLLRTHLPSLFPMLGPTIAAVKRTHQWSDAMASEDTPIPPAPTVNEV